MLSATAALGLLLLAASSSAQSPNHPHGGGACSDDWDCSLGGLCNSTSQCACDPWFTGPSCALLNLQAPTTSSAGTCGPLYEDARYFSWGGRSLLGQDGRYHSFISFMCNHKDLGSWTTASSSAHLVADSPAGEFTWSPEQCNAQGVCIPALIPWSHNTVVLQNAPGVSPKLLIYHVGDGIVPESVWSPCYEKPAGRGSSKSSSEAAPAPEPLQLHPALAPNPGNTAYVATADAPEGPWTRALNNSGVFINFTGSWTSALAGNPAPLIMPDGSVNLYFTATPCPPNSGALASNCIAVATGASWDGPFSMNEQQHPITYPESEDPSVFRDPRGNFHLLTNVNTCHARCPAGGACGGHAWSRDGFTFSNLTIGAFGPVLTFANGSSWKNAYVERPLVTQASDGTPLSFHVGMGKASYGDSCNWVQLFCTGAAGELCGPTVPPPPPPPPAPVQLTKGGQCLLFNASSFPCSGSGARAGCPVLLGPCSSPGSAWRLPAAGSSGAISPVQPSGLALDVDCASSEPLTLVKVLASGASPFSFDAAAGLLRYGGMCLNGGEGKPKPPCGPPGELFLQSQIKLTACSDSSAAGWASVPA
jgi:hypothetical protein